jgi:hypothetical protein
VKEKFLSEDADTGKYFLLIPLNTKRRHLAIGKAETIINDILNSIDAFKILDKNREEEMKNPESIEDMIKLEKVLWSIIR